MKRFKKLYYSFSSLFPTRPVQKISPATTLFPYHHLVSDEDVLHVKHLYPYKNVKQFTNDLDHLLKYLNPVSVNEIVAAVKSGNRLPEKSFLLSFDDGFSEVYTVIAPILLQKGVPAIFFINPAFIDNKELFYRCKISLLTEHILTSKNLSFNWQQLSIACGHQTTSVKQLLYFLKSVTNLTKNSLDNLAEALNISFTDYLKNVQPFLTSPQVKYLNSMGFSIGSHSWDHPYYHLIGDEEKLSQTVLSGRFVYEEFDQLYKLFSFPHSDTSLSQTFFDHLIKTWQPDLLFGIQNQKEEIKNKMLHRFNAERPDLSMNKQLNGILLFSLLEQLSGKNKVIRVC